MGKEEIIKPFKSIKKRRREEEEEYEIDFNPLTKKQKQAQIEEGDVDMFS